MNLKEIKQGYLRRFEGRKGKGKGNYIKNKNNFKKASNKELESQLLKALAALLEEQIQFPALSWQFPTVYNSSSRKPNIIFCPLRIKGKNVLPRHKCRKKAHTQEKINK